MAPENPAEKAEKTLQFLVELLKHSNDGKVDWKTFINDMDITTVNAAKKRFKRMMEPYGITERSITAFTTKNGTPKKQAARKKVPDSGGAFGESDTESNKSSPTKKRKMSMVVDPATVSEDDGGLEEAVERSRAARAMGFNGDCLV